jgi:hypothetical protein
MAEHEQGALKRTLQQLFLTNNLRGPAHRQTKYSLSIQLNVFINATQNLMSTLFVVTKNA